MLIMKKLIFISIILSLAVTTTMAQETKDANAPLTIETTPVGEPNFYPDDSGIFTRVGYTYKYRNDPETSWPIVQLYNASTTYLDMEWGYKDGSKISLKKFMGEDKTPDYSSRSLNALQRKSLVDEFFTTEQKAAFKQHILSIDVRFNPSTGRIADVYFSFNRNSPFASVPVDTYRSIELALKQYFTLTVTDAGRKLNFIPMHWGQFF
jgi:hypothetical protein